MIIIVGHNKDAQGAVNYLGETEWSFNSRIANKLSVKLNELSIYCKVIHRPVGTYSQQVNYIADQVKDMPRDVVFSLHFNSNSVPSYGCEVLIVDTISPIDNIIAKDIIDMINTSFSVKERGVKTVNNTHNGYGELNALKLKGMLGMIIEPCFGNNRADAQKLFENEDAYVDILVNAAKKATQLLKSS